jgi:hypothetical protein
MSKRDLLIAEQRIEKELSLMYFVGFGGGSDFLKYDYNKFNDYCCGKLVLAIGQGEFSREVALVTNMAMAYALYQEKRKQLIEEAGLKES